MNTQRAMSDRVRSFLADDKLTREDVQYVYDQILNTYRATAHRLARDCIALVLFAVLFALLATQDLTEVELFGLKLSKFTLILLTIPVVESLLNLRIITNFTVVTICESAIYEFGTQHYSTLHPSKLDELLSPSLNVSPTMDNEFYRLGIGRRILKMMAIAEVLVVLLIPIVFTVWAYIQLFASPNIGVIPTLISLALTLALVLLGILLLTNLL